MEELRIICPDIVKERILEFINNCGFGVHTCEVEPSHIQIQRMEPAPNWPGLYYAIDDYDDVTGVFRRIASYDALRKGIYEGQYIIDCVYKTYDGTLWIAVTDSTTGDPLIAMEPPIPGYKAPDDL